MSKQGDRINRQHEYERSQQSKHTPTSIERHARCGTEFCTLHAAAPEMLEALERANEYFSVAPPTAIRNKIWKKVSAAIAKAKGE